MIRNSTEIHRGCFTWIIYVLAHFHMITPVLLKLTSYELDMFYQPRTCMISDGCERCAYEHPVPLARVFYTIIDVYVLICT